MADFFSEGKIQEVGGSPAVKTVTIDISGDTADSQDAVDLEGYSLVAVYMPAAWTAATISFLATDYDGKPEESEDPTDPTVNSPNNYLPVVDSAGNSVTLTVAANQVIVPTPETMAALAALRFVKIRSSAGQAADRVITLILKS